MTKAEGLKKKLDAMFKNTPFEGIVIHTPYYAFMFEIKDEKKCEKTKKINSQNQ